MVGSLAMATKEQALGGPHGVAPTSASFVTVPLTVGRIVNVIGGADPPAAMTPELLHPTKCQSNGTPPTCSREHDQPVPVADTKPNCGMSIAGRVGNALSNVSLTAICPLLAVPPMLDTTIV
jgi:hypothetical protein